jgi:Sulfotransferase family
MAEIIDRFPVPERAGETVRLARGETVRLARGETVRLARGAPRAPQPQAGGLSGVTLRARIRQRLVANTQSPVDPARTTTLPPIFVGGTGRSGTTITARLLGAHPAYHMIGVEVRFLSSSGGLCDLVEGKTNLRKFGSKMRRLWSRHDGQPGKRLIEDISMIDAALERLAYDLPIDRHAAAAAFTHRLLDPIAAEAGANGWVEMTPGNVRVAPKLLRLFPDMRMIHSMRDGRDVACSVVPLTWGPNDLDQALDWWASSLRAALAATRALPPDRLLAVRVESLVADAREEEYRRLLDFAGLADDRAMRSFFDTRATAQLSHAGRWRTDVPAERRQAFDAHYKALLAGLPKMARDASSPGSRAERLSEPL